MARWLGALSIVALVLAAPAQAAAKKSAKASTKRVGIIAGGPNAAALAKSAAKGLKGTGTVVSVPDGRLQAEATKWGAQLGSDAAYQALAVGMKLSAIVRVTNIEKPGAEIGVVQIRDGATGAVVDDATWRAPSTKGLSTTLTKQLRSRFSGAIASSRPPPASLKPPATPPAPAAPAVAAAPEAPAGLGQSPSATPTPTAVPPDASPLPGAQAAAAPPAASSADLGIQGAAPEARPETGRSRPMLDVELGARVLGRKLQYKDDLFNALPAYSLNTSFAPRGSAQFYPLASSDGFLSGLGITGAIESTVGLQSTTSSGQSFPTSALAYAIGLRQRFGFGERSELGIDVGYDHQGFSISGTASTPKPQIPDVSYGSLSAGLDLRLGLFGPLSLLVGAAYLQVLSSGEISGPAYFQRANVRGVEATVGFAIAVTHAFEVRISGEGRQYGFDFKPQPGDPLIAGGATDRYLSGGVSLAWRN